jgi:hypothetical protein
MHGTVESFSTGPADSSAIVFIFQNCSLHNRFAGECGVVMPKIKMGPTIIVQPCLPPILAGSLDEHPDCYIDMGLGISAPAER